MVEGWDLWRYGGYRGRVVSGGGIRLEVWKKGI